MSKSPPDKDSGVSLFFLPMAHALAVVQSPASVVVDVVHGLLLRRGSPGPGGAGSGEEFLPVEIIGAGKFPPLQEIIRTFLSTTTAPISSLPLR